MIAEQKSSQKAWKLIRPRIQSSLIQTSSARTKVRKPTRSDICVYIGSSDFSQPHRAKLSSLFFKGAEQRGIPTKLQILLGENFGIQKFGCYFIKLQCSALHSVTRDQIFSEVYQPSPLTCAFCEGLFQQVHLKCSEPSLSTLLCHVRGQEEVV